MDDRGGRTNRASPAAPAARPRRAVPPAARLFCRAIVACAWLGAPPGTGRGAPPASASAAPAPASRPSEIDRAVTDLADARWQVRRAAGFTLIDAGETCLPALRRAYGQTRNHEVRLRIRELAEAIYSQGHVPSRGGFLGIRQRPRLRQMDPRVPLGSTWVEVLQAFRDTAADRAGLRPGDLIVGCDGANLPEDPSGQAFSGMVSRHRPGTQVKLEVIHGQGDPTEITVRLGHRPLAVLAEADPETYSAVRAAFEEWWQDWLAPPTSGPVQPRGASSRPATPRPVRR